jgi:hypothetical protein
MISSNKQNSNTTLSVFWKLGIHAATAAIPSLILMVNQVTGAMLLQSHWFTSRKAKGKLTVSFFESL